MTAPAAPVISINPPEGFQYEAGKPIQVPMTSLDFKSLVPKDFAEKEYFKKIDGFDSLFKSFDNAQVALGKKPSYAAPAADAPQEEWDKFTAALRPEKAEEYEFDIAKDIPEELKAPAEMQLKVKSLFHQAGVTKRQATMIQKGFDAMMIEQYKADKAKNDKLDEEMNTFMTKTYSDKAEEKLGRAKAILEAELPKELHGMISKLPNEALQLLAVFANGMADKYMEEDQIPKGGGGGTSQTVDQMRSTAKEKMAAMMKLDAMDPKKAELSKEIDELYKKIADASK